MNSGEIVLTLQEGVRIIRINRPKTKNAFNYNVYTTITETLTSDSNNDDVVVTIITGTGEYYSSGFDIKSAIEFPQTEEERMNDLRTMIKAIISYPKLLIALINGPALGIAVTTAALCDIIYASDKATFETPFWRLGVCPEGCSSYTFPRILGRGKASEMLFMGKKLSAQEAYQFGFVAEVVPHEKLEEFTRELKKFGKLYVHSVKATKKLILQNYEQTLSECCDRELEQLAECFASEEYTNAIINFITKKSKL